MILLTEDLHGKHESEDISLNRKLVKKERILNKTFLVVMIGLDGYQNYKQPPHKLHY